MKRKLTTIFCADVAGYSRMMGMDEARTLATLKEYREAIEGFIERHHGRVVSWSGDGLLAEFASVVEAVQCAAEIQRELSGRNNGREEGSRMTFRIGINLGDVMADGDDIFGEGVNIAARLQQMAAPGGILVSSSVYEQVRGKLSMSFSSLGAQTVKNISGEVAVYAVTMAGVTPQKSVAAPQAGWGDAPAADAPERAVRKGKLFRRGLALAIDYGIVAAACFAGALALNTFVAPTTVRMDLDVPFVSYHGDRIDSTPWTPTRTVVEDNVTITEEERIVTYDYLGLFQQTYRQKRARGRVSENRAAAPAPPEAAPGTAPVAPPAAPAPPAPPVSIDDGRVVIGDGAVVIDSDGVRIEPPSGEPGDDGVNLSFSVDIDDDKGWGFSFSSVSERLLDPATGKEITRPSLDVLTLILLALYFAVMEAGRAGSTVGKRAFDLYVTREDGRPLGLAAALGRNVIKVLSSFIFPIAILVAFFSRRRQGIHDRIVGTVVVREA
ncbi:MAG: RDD family protein [Alphaproteobacteria bacterium]|nr:RDD family protein [Alphaproteobacteria bacterium]